MAGQKMLIVVGGPTASGKTSLAIQLATHFNTEILSADSRQFYKEMSIGTAKPTKDELALAPHHFIGHISIQDDYSAGKFEEDAMALITELFKNKDQIILAGGSGLFLKAVTEGLDNFPEIDPNIRIGLNEEYEKKGIQHLQAQLQKVDPNYYQLVDKDNPRRLIRALEVIRSSGNTMSFYQKGTEKKRPFSIVYLQPHWTREKLYQRIDQRVELMFESGLEEEVKGLQDFKNLQSLQTVGYQEVFSYLDGNSDLNTAKSLIQQNSRRYAKRQLTWARQRGQWVLLRPNFSNYAIEYLDFIKNGWSWKIEQLKRVQKGTHDEEKISRITFVSDEQQAQIIITKQPKLMQAYWEVSSNIDKKIQQFLLDQLEMRADNLQLLVWSKINDATIFKNELEQSQASYFPFEPWVSDRNELIIFRKSK